MKNRNALIYLASILLCFFSSLSFSQSCSLHDSRAAALAACQASSYAIVPGVSGCIDYPSEKVFVHSSYTLENSPGLLLDFGRNTCEGSKRNCKHYSFSYTTCEEGTVWLQESCSCGTPPECPPGEVKDPITGNCGPVDCSGKKGQPQTSKVAASDSPPRMGCGGGCEFTCGSCGFISETQMGCACHYTGNNCPIEESPPPTEGGGGDEGGGDEGGGDEGGGDEGGGDEGGGGNGGLPNGCMKDESGTIWCVGDGEGDGDGDGDGDGNGKGIASGTCKNPPQMDGDPQLAGIHHQIWLQMCHGEHLKDDDVKNAFQNDEGLTDSDDLSLDDIKKDKTDDFNSAVNSALSGVSMGGGSATCPLNDISGTIFGASYTIELTRVCPYFSLIRGAVLLFFFITSVNVIFQAIRD